jgi:hypothetical protein
MSTQRIEPEQDTTGQIINCARMNGLVIRCRGAAGECTDMVHSGADNLWIVCRRLAGDRDTWIVEHPANESLRNIIRFCRPDVELIEESDSLLAGDSA